MAKFAFSDVGPYGITPLWVVEHASPRALQVWCLLNAKWADRDTGECHPHRATIAGMVGVSEDTVDRAIKELEALGALEVQARFTEHGDRAANLYRIILSQGSRTNAGTPPQECGDPSALVRGPGRMDAAVEEQESLNKNQEPTSSSPPSESTATEAVDGRDDRTATEAEPAGRHEDESPVVSDSTIEPEIVEAATIIEQRWGKAAARDLGLLEGRPAWAGRLDASGVVECVRLAVYLSELIREAGNSRVPNPFTARACNPVRMMLEKDEHTPQQIEVLSRWALNDPFWCANILSTAKLREKWDQLRHRRNEDLVKRQRLVERERRDEVAEVGEDWMARSG